MPFLCLSGGCLLSLLLGLGLFQSWGWVFSSFFAIETAALILGIVAWDKHTGKAAVILLFALMLAWIPGTLTHMAQVAPNETRSSLLPEITQVIGAVQGNITHWLDLDTGRQMSLSFPDDETAKLALFRTNGLGLMGIVTKKEIGVACREMVVRQVEGSRWERAAAQEIVSETAG